MSGISTKPQATTGLMTPSVDLDVFVFRRVAEGRYAHLGGKGRGEGWAGIVEVDLENEPAIAHAVAKQVVVVHDTVLPTQLFGPYWAREGLVVPVGGDELVVIGGAGALSLTPGKRDSLARSTSDRIGDVSPAKRLGDELELLHAVSEVALTELTHLDEVAAAVLSTAARSLSCELGILRLPSSNLLVVQDEDAPGSVSTQDAVDLLDALSDTVGAHGRCFQRLSPADRQNMPDSFDWLLSLLVIPLDVEPGAVLLLAHTTGGPRGFTDLCRDIGARVAEASRTVLMAAMQHDQLRRRADDADTLARTDEMTGLLNRRGWEAALQQVPSDAPRVSVILADGNCLKQINDTDGHDVGDDHINAWGEAIRKHVRGADAIARIGGDEFGVLLVGAGPKRCETIAAAVTETLRNGPLDTSIAIGYATADGSDLAALVRRADQAMYADKGGQGRC